MILTAIVNYTTDNHKKKNDVVPCPKRGDVTHALSEARW
jgi:hypothetical protein